MRNPFEAFKDYHVSAKGIPLDEIIASRDLVMSELIEAYEGLMEHEARKLVWIMNRENILTTYSQAEEAVRHIDYAAEDIEEFCYELDQTRKIHHLITGPPSIFISALCNHALEDEIVLQLGEMHRRIDLLGYRLPAGKQLIIGGDAGNVAGCEMEGGELIIKGNAGNYTGAWMHKGTIIVEGNAGYHTGEGMHDGEIRIAGRIRSLGNVRHGRIYQGHALIYSDRDTTP